MDWCHRNRVRRSNGEEIYGKSAGTVIFAVPVFLWIRKKIPGLVLMNRRVRGPILELREQLIGIGGGRHAGLTGATNGDGFVSGKMRQSLLERSGQSVQGSSRSEAQHGFAEAVDLVRGVFEGLGRRVARGSGDHDLYRMIGK